MGGRLTTLVRGFDWRLPSNRFVLVGSVAAALGSGVFEAVAGEPSDAVRHGIEAGFTFLLSWALARELDPDRPAAATVAAVLGLLIGLLGTVNLGALAALLFALRVLGRTTGPPPTPIDLVWLPALAAYTARSTKGFLAGLAVAAALAMDAPRGRRVWQAGSAVASAVLALGFALARDTAAPGPAMPSALEWLVLGAALISLPFLRRPAPAARADLTREPLVHARVVRARTLAVGAGVAFVAWLGGDAAPARAGLWAALVGVALAGVVVRAATGARPASRPGPGTRRPR